MNKKGFSTLEMLLTIVIMGFAGALAAVGISVGTATYRKGVVEEKAQSIMSEYANFVRATLRTTTTKENLETTHAGTASANGAVYSAKYGKYGDFVVENDVLVFEPLERNPLTGLYAPTDGESLLLVPSNMTKESIKELYETEISYRYNSVEKHWEVTITLESNANGIDKTQTFTVVPAGDLIN